MENKPRKHRLKKPAKIRSRWQKALDDSNARLAEQHPEYKKRLAKQRKKKK